MSLTTPMTSCHTAFASGSPLPSAHATASAIALRPGHNARASESLTIATGSLPVVPKPWQLNDPRVMDSTAALLLPDVPKTLLVIGGGYIGLEIGSVYAALGSKVTVVEALDSILAMADRDLVTPLERKLNSEFEAIYTSTKVASLEAKPEGIVVTLEGKDVPGSITFDRVLLLAGGDVVKVGAPTVAGATVTAEVIGHEKGEKLYIQKMRRRKNYRRRTGHRQQYTRVRIEAIGA